MGVVYKARDTRLGRTVALKFLPSQWSHDEQAKQRFVREAQAASATDHRNICTIHDIATADDGQLFIVMAYYEGPTLKQRLDEGPLPVDEALDIATQIAEGLARAHAQGVVHRDVKPGNVILAEDGVRLLDFGLATFADALQLTVAGSTLGTAAYMSPEQVRGEVTDARTDVWAAGIILYQMLTGHVPFRGTYAEAVAHAIRNDTPAPIRAERPEVTEEVEQIVFRALHKETAIRFHSGRELARALRQARGQTVPVDLRTEPVAVPADRPRPRTSRRRTAVWLALGALALAAVSFGVWLRRPPVRPVVAVLPVSNQTGREELSPFQRALTLALIEALSASPVVRPVSWTRSLQDLRRHDAALASVDAAGALAGVQGAGTLIVPILEYEDRGYRLRIEVRDGASATTVRAYTTRSMVSSLPKQTAYALVSEGATLVADHFGRRNPRQWLHAGAPRLLASLEALRAFEAGLTLYDEQEYAPALAAFAEAATLDPASAAPQVWRSRAALAMRDRKTAAVAATAAERLMAADAPPAQRLLAAAVIAEARGEYPAARTGWRALVDAVPDEPAWVLEQALFDDRLADTREAWSAAVAGYRAALARDGSLVRPHLELCRLYNRLQEGPSALKEGELALAMYRRAGWKGGEALAMFCLVDALRTGSAGERGRARDLAVAARDLLTGLGHAYNLPRATYYEGLAVAEQNRLPEAVALWQQALTAAEQAGNLPLQPIVLNNLGVAQNRLGDPAAAAAAFTRSAELFEATGDERRAARQQFNSAVLRINYGIGMQAAVRDIENALTVVERQGDVDFEVGCREILGMFHREAMDYAESSRQLNLAMTLATQHRLEPRIAAVTVQLAALAFEQADYARARRLLEDLLAADPGRSTVRARILLGRVEARLGNTQAARGHLDGVLSDLDRQDDTGVRPFLYLSLGELAHRDGQDAEARAVLRRAAVADSQPYAEAASVEAGALAGLIDGRAGRVDSGRALIAASLRRADDMGYVALAARARLMLAQLEVAAGRPDAAAAALGALPEDARLNPELRRARHALLDRVNTTRRR